MKSTVATRFRCRSPLTDLKQGATMFLTLIFQYLNKLVESKIGDFTSPQAFHAIKVQGFKDDCIKCFAKVSSKGSPMKIFALVADFSIQACDLSHTPPPPVRTFLFTTQLFVKRPKLVQVRFQRLWVLFLFTRAQSQICVFHTEVCPNTLTRCRQRFCFYKIREYVEPIITASVALDRDTPDIPVKLTVLMERIPNFIMSPFACIPFSEVEGEPIVSQRPARLFQGERFELVSRLDMGSAAKSLEKTLIRQVNTFQFLLNCLAWQRFPMRVRGAFQLGYVKAHCRVVRIRQPVFIAVTLPLVEVFMHLPHIVKQGVSKPNTIGLIIKRIFVGFHGISHITPFNPYTMGWQTRHQAVALCMFASVIV